MNAKEISDATLPAVTPADNDLMLIYDTSEGTTGKATIADIAPKVAEYLKIPTYSKKSYTITDVISTDVSDISFTSFSLESYGHLKIINARVKIFIKQNISGIQSFETGQIPQEIIPMLENFLPSVNLICLMSWLSGNMFPYECAFNIDERYNFTIRINYNPVAGENLIFTLRAPFLSNAT